MKYALILAADDNGTLVPAESSPTVLLLSAGATIPLEGLLEDAFDGIAATVGTGTYADASLKVMKVRVENTVVPGDKLEQSGDVWHKVVGG